VLAVLGITYGGSVMLNERQEQAAQTIRQPTTSCIDWYAEGQSRVVEVAGVQITVRFVGRKGRRGRIAIEAPAGAVFAALNDDKPIRA
jgi:hypothetical protein